MARWWFDLSPGGGGGAVRFASVDKVCIHQEKQQQQNVDDSVHSSSITASRILSHHVQALKWNRVVQT
jgi:hypothetical protein